MSKSAFSDHPQFQETVNRFINNLHAELREKKIPLKIATLSFHEPLNADDCECHECVWKGSTCIPRCIPC